MSAFVAVLEPRGRTVRTEMLEALRRGLEPRAPDGGGLWCDGEVGLVQAWLRTGVQDEALDPGPVRLAHFRIAGDVRLDDRDALLRALAVRKCAVSAADSDLTLVLHAYAAWGEDCLDRLAGDFAFVAWDGVSRRMFAARDQLGVVPLYWTRTPTSLILSNSLLGTLAHSAVDAGFDREMIADQLAVGIRTQPDRSCYAAIRRLPAGHCLRADESDVSVRRYWEMPERGAFPERRHPADYAEAFRELFDQALRDRLRGATVATHLSGGMDASSVAVSLARMAGGASLKAYTHIVSELFADPEAPVAAEIARHAGIAWEAIAIEPLLSGDDLVEARNPVPEPMLPLPLSFRGAIERRAAADGARVLFNGYGGDPLFVGTRAEGGGGTGLRERAAELRDIAYCALREPGLVPLWLAGRGGGGAGSGSLRRAIAPDTLLDRDFAAEFQVDERRRSWAAQPPAQPIAGMATHPVWMARLTEADPDHSGVALRQRFPFFDLRLIRFAAGLPVRPWRTSKTLLRLAMRDRLPRAVYLRPKMGAPEEVLGAFLRARGPRPWMYELIETPGIEAFVDRAAARRCIETDAAQDRTASRRLVFLFCVAHWLRSRPR